MKRIRAMLIAITLIIALAACGQEDGGSLVTPIVPDTGDEDDYGEEYPIPTQPEDDEPAELPQILEYDQASGEGYAFEYDSGIFAPAGEDTWEYTGEAGSRIYIAVQRYPDMTPEDVAAGLALQSGVDGVEPEDVVFGAEGVPAKRVYIERDGAAQTFYAVTRGEGTLLVETGSYTGAPERAQGGLDTILGTFTVV